MRDISRRSLLKNGGAAATVGASSLVSGCVSDVAGSGGLKIGVIQPLTAYEWGPVSVWSFLSGLARVYGEDLSFKPGSNEVWAGASLTFEPGDGERKYEFLFRDTVFKPQNAEAAAKDLVVEDDVDILFGPTDSSGTIRVIENVAKPTGTLYVAGGASTLDMIQDPSLCGRKIFRANEHTGMEARALSKYIAEETDTETIYLLSPSTSYGRSFAEVYRQTLTERGVEVAGERLFPSGFGSFRQLFVDIDDKADGVVLGVTLRTIRNVLTTFAEGNASGAFDLKGYGGMPGEVSMGLFHYGIKNALDVDEVTSEIIKEEAGIGGLASRYHWNQYDNPINDEFISDFVESYGRLPALFAGGTYAAGSAIAQAVEATGSQDPDDIADEMYGMTVEQTPKGKNGYVFQEHNNQAKSEMTVANLVPNENENWGAPLMPSEPIMRLSADEAAIPKDDPDMECDLTTQ